MIISFCSCSGNNKKDQPKNKANLIDSVQHDNNNGLHKAADSSLYIYTKFFEEDLALWARSFSGFNIDSFRLTQRSEFEQTEHQDASDLKAFYELYKPSLSFSPDSSLFIDLYSTGITLEKMVKKLRPSPMPIRL